eukprot:2640551-Pleurochrysis_carterae.AAC.1
MSKTLDPMEDERAMSPWPSRATSTEESASGMDVPAASTVTPITASGMPAHTSAHKTAACGGAVRHGREYEGVCSAALARA